MLITTSRAAQILQLSEGTVRALERRGQRPAIRTDGGNGVRQFELKDVEALARKRAADVEDER